MEIIETIKSANTAFYRAIESGSVERMEELWLHEDYVRCVHPGWDVVTGIGQQAYSLGTSCNVVLE